MKKYLFFVVLGLGVLTQNYAFSRDLTLDDTVKMVVSESQDIKKAKANLEKMQAVRDNVSAARGFKLTGTASYSNYPDISGFSPFGGTSYPATVPPAGVDNVGAIGIAITQPIYTFGKVGYG